MEHHPQSSNFILIKSQGCKEGGMDTKKNIKRKRGKKTETITLTGQRILKLNESRDYPMGMPTSGTYIGQ
jgi:hypothetical protein